MVRTGAIQAVTAVHGEPVPLPVFKPESSAQTEARRARLEAKRARRANNAMDSRLQELRSPVPVDQQPVRGRKVVGPCVDCGRVMRARGVLAGDAPGTVASLGRRCRSCYARSRRSDATVTGVVAA